MTDIKKTTSSNFQDNASERQLADELNRHLDVDISNTLNAQNKRTGSKYSFNNSLQKERADSNQNSAFQGKAKNHIIMKIKHEDKARLLSKHKDLTVSNYVLNNILNSEKSKIDVMKEKLNQLNQTLDDLKLENEAMLFTKFNEEIDWKNYEISQKTITKYCNDMKRKAFHIEDTIQEYEDLQLARKEENQILKKTYETQIKKSSKLLYYNPIR